MNTIQGLILIDTTSAALNNAGDDVGAMTDNTVAVKKFRKNKKEYPYISAQAWRYWWRNLLKEKYNWNLSPIFRDKKIAFTEADPIKYPDDDMFGYMKAEKKATLTRVSPLKCSSLMAVSPVKVINDFGVMSRHEGDPVPFEHQHYSSVMKGIFSIDLDRVGTFSREQRAGQQNITEELAKKVLENGGKELVKDKLYTLKEETIIKRIADTLMVLPYLYGGANQTLHHNDVSPKMIILLKFKGGNHILADLINEENDIPKFNIKALEEIIDDYSNDLESKIYIGRREGFMNEIAEELEKLAQTTDNIVLTTPKKAVEQFCQINKYIVAAGV